MKFLVYSMVNERSIASSLGMADYSYYFVMKRYLPLLEAFGEVEVLDDPPTDQVVEGCGGDCVYLSFTPPDKAVRLTRCPVIVVFAWEFSSIPAEPFTRPEDNWVEGLRVLGRALTHSSFAVAVVRNQVGESFSISSIPAPLWDSCAAVRKLRQSEPPLGLSGIDLNCTIIDSASYELSNTQVRPRTQVPELDVKPLGHEWHGEPIEVSFSAREKKSALVGFNLPEDWGVWAKPGYPWVLLDQLVEGWVEIEVVLQGYAQHVGGDIGLEFGTGHARLPLTAGLSTQVARLYLEHPTNVLAFVGITDNAVGMMDPRDISFGLASIVLRRVTPMPDTVLNLNEPELPVSGFHPAEPWGRWTAEPACTVALPQLVCGDVEIRLQVSEIGNNDNNTIQVSLGSQTQALTLQQGNSVYSLRFLNVASTAQVQLHGIVQAGTGVETDPRSVGFLLADLTCTVRAPVSPAPNQLQPAAPVPTGDGCGVLYTAILNPRDARKNWEDIITAFIYAFRDRPEATLLVKITYHDLTAFFEDIFTFFIELHPFSCRLIFIHGYLEEPQYQQLLLHSHFIVNASAGEGQCLPLMEFMSCGIPALAPANTAMLDYIDESNAFVVDSAPEPTCWPQDPRYVLRTFQHRIDWESLVRAFQDSERIVRETPDRYREMAQSAVAAQERFCSLRVAGERFGAFLNDLSAKGH